MASFNEYRRRSILPLAGVALAAYYLLVFVPLSRHVQSLDEPLQKAWHKLAGSLGQTNATTLDFLHVTSQLNETRQARAILEDTRKQAATRLELPAELRSKFNAPFQLVDYQNERSTQMDELDRQAKQQKIAVEAAVFAGFPEHTVNLKEPALLWPALSFTQDLLATAVNCKVTAIHSLEVTLAGTNSAPAEAEGGWAEIPLQIEFTAPAEGAVRLIQSLPLRAQEIHAAGLPEASPHKVPLFLDRLLIKKQNPEKPDEVRVWLQVVGFVLRD